MISFLYCAFRSIDLGLKTAIIVAPVNVLHNWKHEFLKWKPLDVKALHVYMLEDVLRFNLILHSCFYTLYFLQKVNIHYII